MMRLYPLVPLALLAACAGHQNMTLDPAKAPVVAGGSAIVPGCPDWSDAAATPSAGATGSNYGCATLGNLAAMVADPNDLVRGRTGDAGLDGRTSVKAIGAWRTARTTGETGLKAESVRDGGGSK